MPGQINDLTGQPFGRLTVKELDVVENGHAYWWCECSCGCPDWVSVRGSKLVEERVVSCGCYRAAPIVRKAARLTTPAKERIAIARKGGRAAALQLIKEK